MIKIDYTPYLEYLDIQSEGGKQYVFDPIRQKRVVLQPEEMVRQLFLQYIIKTLTYPVKRIQVEKMIKVHQMTKRFDVVIYGKNGLPKLLVECKRHNHSIDQKVFEQISSYNLAMRVDYLIVTNGIDSFACQMDYEKKTHHFLKEMPHKAIFD